MIIFIHWDAGQIRTRCAMTLLQSQHVHDRRIVSDLILECNKEKPFSLISCCPALKVNSL